MKDFLPLGVALLFASSLFFLKLKSPVPSAVGNASSSSITTAMNSVESLKSSNRLRALVVITKVVTKEIFTVKHCRSVGHASKEGPILMLTVDQKLRMLDGETF